MGIINSASALTHLVCPECKREVSADQLQTYCHQCMSPWLAVYDLKSVRQDLDRDEISRRSRGMWRWAELLPVHAAENRITLGEGDTPLLKLDRMGASLGLEQLYLKDEGANPTGSFKARGMAAAISKARELGVSKVIVPTAGNAGGAIAAYAARAGMKACVIMPQDTPRANRIECEIAGAEVVQVEGLISDAAKIVARRAPLEGWFDVSTFKEPYRTEGKKVMGFELAEAFGWRLPDVIIYPTGGGTGLVGMAKAFDELEALGWLEDNRRPRLVSVQAAGCAPVVKAFESGAQDCEFWEGAHTVASGLRVPKSFAGKLILSDLRRTQGTAIAIEDELILDAQHKLAQAEGIFAAPESAATIAAADILRMRGWLSAEEKVVCFNTGTGLKYI